MYDRSFLLPQHISELDGLERRVSVLAGAPRRAAMAAPHVPPHARTRPLQIGEVTAAGNNQRNAIIADRDRRLSGVQGEINNMNGQMNAWRNEINGANGRWNNEMASYRGGVQQRLGAPGREALAALQPQRAETVQRRGAAAGVECQALGFEQNGAGFTRRRCLGFLRHPLPVELSVNRRASGKNHTLRAKGPLEILHPVPINRPIRIDPTATGACRVDQDIRRAPSIRREIPPSDPDVGGTSLRRG
mgnify:CR=1 FL=1